MTSSSVQTYSDGYRDGFDAGVEVGAARILVELQGVLHDQLPAALDRLPHTGTYARIRQIRDDIPTTRCPLGCGTCGRCRSVQTQYRYRVLYGWPEDAGITDTVIARIRQSWNDAATRGASGRSAA